MTDAKRIEAAIQRLLQAAPPGSQVILFGSHARGTADARSDVDLMVVEPRVVNRHAESVRLRDALGQLPGGFDIVVASYSQEARHRRLSCIRYEAPLLLAQDGREARFRPVPDSRRP